MVKADIMHAMRQRATSLARSGDPLRSVLREVAATLRRDFAQNPAAEPRVTLTVWRVGQAAHGRRGVLFFLIRRLHGFLDLVWTRSMIGAELPRSVPAGPGLRLPHAGRGTILHPSTRIGAGVTLYHQVTVGVRGGGRAATIEDGVYIGAGAKIIGQITLGAGCRVGANAVVLKDVPGGGTAVGVPSHTP
jgi:serine O-acetyltransferase